MDIHVVVPFQKGLVVQKSKQEDSQIVSLVKLWKIYQKYQVPLLLVNANIKSNLNHSNTFGTMEICLRYG